MLQPTAQQFQVTEASRLKRENFWKDGLNSSHYSHKTPAMMWHFRSCSLNIPKTIQISNHWSWWRHCAAVRRPNEGLFGRCLHAIGFVGASNEMSKWNLNAKPKPNWMVQSLRLKKKNKFKISNLRKGLLHIVLFLTSVLMFMDVWCEFIMPALWALPQGTQISLITEERTQISLITEERTGPEGRKSSKKYADAKGYSKCFLHPVSRVHWAQERTTPQHKNTMNLPLCQFFKPSSRWRV